MEPFDTKNVKSDKSLIRLLELLARHNHEKWYQSRLHEGWSYAEQQDDEQKTSPCMVSYEQLPEEHKNLALAAARDILKTILDHGYSIAASEKTADLPIELSAIEKQLEYNETPHIDLLTSLWRNREHSLWEKHPSLFLRAGRQMLSAGEPLLAYDILSEGVDVMGGLPMLGELEGPSFSLLVSLLQQQSLALAQSGASDDANTILLSLFNAGLKDSETLGILGRTWKDKALLTNNGDERKRYLEKAFACYNKAYEADRDAGNLETAYYTGINAASVSLLADNFEQSRIIAGQIRDICDSIFREKHDRQEPVPFWLHATLGEASLLQGDMVNAEKFYIAATKGCSRDIRAMGSMRRQARLILDATGRNTQALDHCFPVPSVVLFSGHIIDQPSRNARRFPKENEELARGRIAQWLEEHNGQIAYSSAACGSDILFLEEMLKRDGEINVVLPFAREHFIQTSVDVVPDGNWVERFERVISKANEIKVLSQYNKNTLDDDLLFANLYMYGTAQVRAERAGTDLEILLVWDRQRAKSVAGTAALAELIETKGNRFAVISPLDSQDTEISDSQASHPFADPSDNSTPIALGDKNARHHSFLPLLFADVKGYSRLSKEEKLSFASHFMGEMASVLKKFDDRIFGKKTQGDSLFLVFKDLPACVQSARALRERTADIDWTEFGLSSQLTMRISLDAGPCYSYTDPITAQRDFCGDYIVRAARLEPVTPPGNIYASETFVAVAKALGVKDIQFDYAGQVELPKGYGRIQAFHVK